jgi:DNA-binding NtrC family response regulator
MKANQSSTADSEFPSRFTSAEFATNECGAHRPCTTVPVSVSTTQLVAKNASLSKVRGDDPDTLGNNWHINDNEAAWLLGPSRESQKVGQLFRNVTSSMIPVLIVGESGTGKEIVARAIHTNSPSADKPFVPIDCKSLVPDLLASELFGHAKGAFAGAKVVKHGMLSAAGCGTVFLDEIGELPLNLQGRLLRALQEKEVRPMGSTHAVPISARVLAATNCDLNLRVQQGGFRRDLYCRLNMVNLRVPALWERKTDIPGLIAHLLGRILQETNTTHSFSDEALLLMNDYNWPGNMRELENSIYEAVARSSETVLQVADLPKNLREFCRERNEGKILAADPVKIQESPLTLETKRKDILPIAEMEKMAILRTIDQLDGDKVLAAKLLGIGKTKLYRKLKQYGVHYSGYGFELNNPG